MTNIQITEQYKQLLDLIAETEAKNGSYDSRNPNLTPAWVSKSTIQEIRNSQTGKFGAPATGRYQFLGTTLIETTRDAGLDPRTTIYSPPIQDYLGATLAKNRANSESWLAGNVPDNIFVFNLSKIWAGIGVPAQDDGTVFENPRNVLLGQSYYLGEANPYPQFKEGESQAEYAERIAKMSANFVRRIKSIRTGIPVDQIALEFDPDEFKSDNPQGTTLEDQYAGVAAGGGDYYKTGVPNRKFDDVAPTNVYGYDIIDPFDDRYDFRTGRKVRDLLVNGTESLRDNASKTTSPFNNEPGTTPQPGSKEAEPVGEAKTFPVAGDEITTKMNEILSEQDAGAIVGESLTAEYIEILKSNGYDPRTDQDFEIIEPEPLYPDPLPDEPKDGYLKRLRELGYPYLRLPPEIIEKYFSDSDKSEEPKPVTGSKAESRSQELGLSSALPETPTLPSSAIRSIRRSF